MVNYFQRIICVALISDNFVPKHLRVSPLYMRIYLFPFDFLSGRSVPNIFSFKLCIHPGQRNTFHWPTMLGGIFLTVLIEHRVALLRARFCMLALFGHEVLLVRNNSIGTNGHVVITTVWFEVTQQGHCFVFATTKKFVLSLYWFIHYFRIID